MKPFWIILTDFQFTRKFLDKTFLPPYFLSQEFPLDKPIHQKMRSEISNRLVYGFVDWKVHYKKFWPPKNWILGFGVWRRQRFVFIRLRDEGWTRFWILRWVSDTHSNSTQGGSFRVCTSRSKWQAIRLWHLWPCTSYPLAFKSGSRIVVLDLYSYDLSLVAGITSTDYT